MRPMPLDPSGPLDRSGHVDTFARDHLPPRELWPVMEYGTVPELDYPKRLNAAVELLAPSHIAGSTSMNRASGLVLG